MRPDEPDAQTIRALARCLERRPAQATHHQGRRSIPRDLALLLRG